MARQPRQRTLLECAVRNLLADGVPVRKAIPKAAKAVETVIAYAIAAEALGYWPKQAEYAAHWEIDERTAQREWAAVRAAFPGETSPQRLAALVRAALPGGLGERVSDAMSLPAPPGLAAA